MNLPFHILMLLGFVAPGMVLCLFHHRLTRKTH
jgi:hypothetical protein